MKSDFKDYTVIGIMSGTSMDGVDIVLCDLRSDNKKWSYKIHESFTFGYDYYWKRNLIKAVNMPSNELSGLHDEYGEYLGNLVNQFLSDKDNKVDLIASHGHTIHHEPEKGITFQLGNGDRIASVTGKPTVSDFRSLDVSLGGQGAPLVPIGDELLFSEYDYCLNLGGFANISYNLKGRRLAYDICPVNIAINHFTAIRAGKEMDKDGNIAKEGRVDNDLLRSLNDLAYYYEKGPKSLSREWLEKEFLPSFKHEVLDISDLLRTIYEHIAVQINKSITNGEKLKVLVSGGGARNKFLMQILRALSNCDYIIPSDELVDYKEALIFGLLGILRYRNENNCLASVTGATKDCSGGVLFVP